MEVYFIELSIITRYKDSINDPCRWLSIMNNETIEDELTL